MITLNKLKIYKKHNGDIDSWARLNSNSSDITEEDWHLIDTFFNDLHIVQKGLASNQFTQDMSNRLINNLEDDFTITYLSTLVGNHKTGVTIELYTHIKAPIEKCFDLSRSIDLHLESTKHTGEKAIAGRTNGLIELGETVTWRAKHFFIWQNLTTKITEFNSPHFFADEMVSGAFKSFRHEHHFTSVEVGTLMRDVFVFESPCGLLGKFFNLIVLTAYMESLLTQRNEVIKQVAESGKWEELKS